MDDIITICEDEDLPIPEDDCELDCDCYEINKRIDNIERRLQEAKIYINDTEYPIIGE